MTLLHENKLDSQFITIFKAVIQTQVLIAVNVNNCAPVSATSSPKNNFKLFKSSPKTFQTWSFSPFFFTTETFRKASDHPFLKRIARRIKYKIRTVLFTDKTPPDGKRCIMGNRRVTKRSNTRKNDVTVGEI